jgi:hypothetical protein
MTADPQRLLLSNTHKLASDPAIRTCFSIKRIPSITFNLAYVIED